MRHGLSHKKLNRTSEHRKALLKNMLNSLSLFLGMEIPNWPPDNIAELSKKLEDNS